MISVAKYITIYNLKSCFGQFASEMLVTILQQQGSSQVRWNPSGGKKNQRNSLDTLTHKAMIYFAGT